MHITHISVRKMGGYRLVTLAEWQKIDKEERKALILEGDADFLSEEGNIVPSLEALTWMQEQVVQEIEALSHQIEASS